MLVAVLHVTPGGLDGEGPRLDEVLTFSVACVVLP